ncbi:hypothetical protein BDBG_00789 [Blastomyces gilchristii SLH14081]|uniref:Uncharacterized protein n=2 Tax=Blastomyces TaxID=229219 RepID=A0A179U853_BLAGS|nr:uncharacterized protein BDBG_00789 [Blastomyces gilchristii SLH14081]EGE82760.2 hypothetical protein BDDG_05704 [Blastomyces dermatitidis ATCC 18188]OAT04175.1 hypothetical protein BDBG_00789 [Blastomyces gilchristii SLH14081]
MQKSRVTTSGPEIGIQNTFEHIVGPDVEADLEVRISSKNCPLIHLKPSSSDDIILQPLSVSTDNSRSRSLPPEQTGQQIYEKVQHGQFSILNPKLQAPQAPQPPTSAKQAQLELLRAQKSFCCFPFVLRYPYSIHGKPITNLTLINFNELRDYTENCKLSAAIPQKRAAAASGTRLRTKDAATG